MGWIFQAETERIYLVQQTVSTVLDIFHLKENSGLLALADYWQLERHKPDVKHYVLSIFFLQNLPIPFVIMAQLPNLVCWLTLSLLSTCFYFIKISERKSICKIYYFALNVSLAFKKTDAQLIDSEINIKLKKVHIKGLSLLQEYSLTNFIIIIWLCSFSILQLSDFYLYCLWETDLWRFQSWSISLEIWFSFASVYLCEVGNHFPLWNVLFVKQCRYLC